MLTEVQMNFADLNWMQVESYLQKDDRLILVLGACEQHGYLSLTTDTKTPLAMAKAASQESGVLVAPPINFGCSPYFLDYPGTISLRLHTYLDVIEDVLRSLYGVGFRKVLLLNGHGGNTPVRTHLVELVNEMPDLTLRWYAWWTTETVAKIAEKYDLVTQHANWMEAFDFNRVASMPSERKPIPDKTDTILGKKVTREIYGDGSFGGKYQVEESIMKEVFGSCLEEILELLKFKEPA
jgi:creatinine amidohydrolase